MIMWTHYCKNEETTMEIGQNEECNWCGMSEEDIYKSDGFEDALLGRGQQFNSDFYVYSHSRCIEILKERDGMTEEEALEYFDYNVQGAWVGKGTPIFVYDERWREWNDNK